MTLKPGIRLRSGVCSTQVVLVRVSDPTTEVSCGGVPMTVVDGAATATPQGAPAPGFDGGTVIGKRYGGGNCPVEVLCTRAGDGSLSIGEQLLNQRQAQALPSSD